MNEIGENSVVRRHKRYMHVVPCSSCCGTLVGAWRSADPPLTIVEIEQVKQ